MLLFLESSEDESMGQAETLQNRRFIKDRRMQATPLTSLFRFHGQRQRPRRVGDEDRNTYVDYVSARTASMVLLIVVFSITDAAATLLHLERGAQELNPLMNLLIQSHMTFFLGMKGVGVGLFTTFLAVHQNFRISYLALHGLAGTYLSLLIYHTVLFLT
jgi:hypothetical protein